VQVEGIGRPIDWSEFWNPHLRRLRHEIMFTRDRSGGFDNTTYSVRAIHEYHSKCFEVARGSARHHV
jgi:hypothetical protein